MPTPTHTNECGRHFKVLSISYLRLMLFYTNVEAVRSPTINVTFNAFFSFARHFPSQSYPFQETKIQWWGKKNRSEKGKKKYDDKGRICCSVMFWIVVNHCEKIHVWKMLIHSLLPLQAWNEENCTHKTVIAELEDILFTWSIFLFISQSVIESAFGK